MIASQLLCGDRIEGGIIFRIAKDSFLAATTVVKQDHTIGRFALIGHNDLVVIIKISWFKQV